MTVLSLPLPTVTVDAGPLRPGVKPATTPGVLVKAGGAAGATAPGGGGGIAVFISGARAAGAVFRGGAAAEAPLAVPIGAVELGGS